ncbi:MAG: hypothetical protein AB1Z98_02325 [Nannocystaceae bacterium]
MTLALGVVAGCRASALVEAPSEASGPSASVPDGRVGPEPVEPEPVEPVERSASIPATAPPLQMLAVLEPPFSPKALLLRPVEDDSPVVLFADEKDRVRRRVAQQLAARGRRVAPVAELERIEAAAAEGRLVLEGDLQCRAPLSFEELRSRYFPQQPSVWTGASCFDSCTLTASISSEGDDDAVWAYTSGRVTRPHEPRSWTKVRLRPTTGVLGGIGGGMISSHPPPIMFGLPSGIGPWKSPPDGARLQQARVDGCANPDPGPHIEYEIRMAVAADGTIDRCEASTGRPGSGHDRSRCLCQGLADLRYEPGPPGRRLRVSATDSGRAQFPSLVVLPLQPGTEAWAQRLQEAAIVDGCSLEHPPGTGFQATAVLALAPDGGVQGVEIYGPIETPETMRFSTCLVRELAKVPLPCAPPGIDVLQVTIAPRSD